MALENYLPIPHSLLLSVVLQVIILVIPIVAAAQSTSSVVQVITTYSQNEQYYLRSIPFDNEFPSLRGKTYVYRVGSSEPLYVFDRGFDSVDADSNNLILSNDGKVIFYLIPWDPDEQREGLKSITIYKDGRIIKSFAETEINGCDKKKERCELVYSNFDEVVDKERSNWGTKDFKKVFKTGVSEKERFLSDFPIFAFDDMVYVTDSKRNTHAFDLTEGKYLGSQSFDVAFNQIKTRGRFNRTELRSYDAPIFLEFPKLKSGKATEEALAIHLGMTAVDIANPKDEQYKWYLFSIECIVRRDGSVEIEGMDVDPQLPKQKIVEFFSNNRFETSSIPQVFEKWFVEEYFYFRKKDVQIARAEKQQERARGRKEFETRLTLETINGVYIPKDLGECFSELDKLLPEVDRKEMHALSRREDMILYHMGLGMWIRNNWGLWGGSRLQKYFHERGITHPDDMSGLMLKFYYDWLHGQNDNWKAWEKKPTKHRADEDQAD